jgi:hypothetical protein
MGGCVLWAGASYGPVRLIGQEVQYLFYVLFFVSLEDAAIRYKSYAVKH